MKKLLIHVALPFGIAIIVVLILYRSPPPEPEVASAPVHVALVDCKRPDYGGTGWFYDSTACLVALRRHLELNPAQRIVGVIALDRGTATYCLAVIWSLTAGYLARDTFVEELCDHDCLSAMTTTTPDVHSWIPINDATGLRSILQLRSR
jgi:hypothetical protein